MKKLKLFNILLIVAFLFTMPVVHAHEVTLSNEDIKIQSVDGKIYSGSKIVVNTDKITFKEYNVSYQYVTVEDAVYSNYLEKHNEQMEYIESFLKDNNLTKIEDGTQEQISAYNAAVKALEDDKQGVLPGYTESNWVESRDNTTVLDLTEVPKREDGKEQPYVLWIKVASTKEGEGVHYANQVVLAKHQDKDPELKEDNSKTGDEMILVAVGAALVLGVMVVSYKKANA